jgi:hypothetical protein
MGVPYCLSPIVVLLFGRVKKSPGTAGGGISFKRLESQYEITLHESPKTSSPALAEH